MKRLDKVLGIWKDLEGNYLKAVENDRNLSKRRFLEQLLGFKAGVDSPALLKNMLSAEISAYTPEEYTDYESLVEVLDSTYKKLLQNSDEILELDNFVYSDIIQEFSLEDYETFSSAEKVTPIREALNAGHFMDCICNESDLLKHYNMGLEQKGYLIFKTENDALQFLCGDTNKIKASSFYKQVYHVVGNYIMQGKGQYPMVFLDDSLFNVSSKEILVGNSVIPVTKRNYVGRDTFTMKLLSKEEVLVEKLSYYHKKLKDTNVELRVHFIEV